MVKLSGLSKLLSRLSCVGLGVALFGVMHMPVEAKTVTIDADGTATYASLDLFLSAINNAGESTIPDTVLFTGSNQHTYKCATNFYIQSISKTILFIGGTSDPDKFPIINHTDFNCYGFFQNAPIKFERVIFTGSSTFDNGQGVKPLVFSKCIVRNFTSSFFAFAGNGAENIYFDNCLFVNNADTIFKLNFWSTTSRLEFVNCTFDRNKGIFGGNNVAGVTNFVLRNNIFINNTSISKFSNVFAQIQNSLTSEALTGYGAGNLQLFTADTTNLFIKTNRAAEILPSAWKIGSSSKAKNYGTFYARVTTDIAGDLRATSKVDAGCWAADNSLQFVKQPLPDTVTQGKEGTFIATVTNPDGVSYSWHRIGSTDTLGKRDTLRITATAELDSARIYCIASNALATQSSDTVVLRVITAPVLIGDTASRIIVPNGGSKTFTVNAKGLQLRYFWYIESVKVASDSLIPELTIASVTKDAYQNKTIYCEVSNDFSSVKTLSDTIIVSDNLPVITTDLKDITTYVGSTAKFKIVSSHPNPLKSFIWFKTTSAGEKTTIAGATGDSLILTNVALADSNSKIECYVVSAAGDTAKSRAATLIVKSVPKPKITAQSGATIETREGTPLSLFIEYTAIEGVTDTIKWYHVDTLIKNATSKTLTISKAEKANEGVYYCVLSNSAGFVNSSDIKVIVRGASDVYNPIQLTGRLIDRSNVSITIRNFSNLPALSTDTRYVDTIGIWWMTNTAVPGKPNLSSTRLKKYSLTELKSLSGGADTVTVAVPVTLGNDECDTLLFLSSPFWRKPDSLLTFNSGAGAKIYSCGAKNLVNTLTLTKVKQTNETVVVRVSGFGSLQKADASYAVIYFGEKRASSSDTLKNSEFPAESVDLNFTSAEFQTIEKTLNWRIYLRSTNGSYSDTIIKPIQIGFQPPVNDATLIVDSTQTFQALLSWSLSTPADSVAIIYSKLKIAVETNISDTTFKRIVFGGAVNKAEIEGLQASTLYYFALLKKKNGIWSGLAVNAINSKATKVSENATIPNVIKITGSSFDSTKNIFRIKFTFDSTGLGKSEYMLGYTYSTSDYIRDSSSAIDALAARSDVKRIETFLLNPNDTNCFINFDLGNTLQFNKKYYFALFIKGKSARYYESATDLSIASITSGQMNWATILMDTSVKEVHVFDNNVVIKPGNDWQVEKTARINDTLKYIRNVKKLNGFINVGAGVKFVKGNDVPSVYLGMRPDSIPKGYSIEDVHLYLCDTTFSGVYVVPGVQTQSSDSLVSALINTRKPSKYQDSIFVLLIDTIKPIVTQLDTFKTDIVSDLGNVVYRVDIKDNVSDIYVKFVASGWQDTGIVIMDRFVRDTTLEFDMSFGAVNKKSGLYAILIVSDGRFTDTINLSKTVTTILSINTIKDQWVPISVRYNLNNVKISHLVSLLNKDGKYDKAQFRIFKWEENRDKNPNPRKDKYLELDQVKQGDSSLFDLKPGNLLWLKTRETQQMIVLDSLAKTMSMKDPVVVKIPKNQYADFGMPFGYTVKLGDIARASQLIENGINKNSTLSIYQWVKQGETYKSELKYSTITQDDLLEGLPDGESYTATFETPGNEDFLDLQIPPVPIARSTYRGEEIPKSAKRFVDKSNWNFKISSDGNCVFTSVYAGFNPKFKSMGKIQTKLPPTMSDIKVGFLDNDEMYGQLFAGKEEEGYVYTLRFVNDGNESKVINCHITENLPSGKLFKLFNSSTGELTDVKNGLSVTVAAGSSTDQLLLAGSDQYIRMFASLHAGVEFALLQMYPNPFKGALTIKFTLPLTGVNIVNCRLFDALGRTVWNFNIDRDLKPGLNTYNWQPGTHSLKKLASGTYILKLTAEDESGHKKGSGVSRLMYLAD